MTKTIHFSQTPSTLQAYGEMLRHPRSGESALPDLAVELDRALPTAREVRAYQEITGLPSHPDDPLPLLYPQVLAGPLHMQLLAAPEFPLSAPGLLHLRNTITQHAPLPPHTPLALRATLGSSREVDAGLEFDIFTTAHVEGECRWEAVTTLLQRKTSRKDTSKAPRERVPDASSVSSPQRSVTVRVPANQGRRYAAICKDYNPIHLSALTAKLFGFKRGIAHGMWMLGRAMAEIYDDMPQLPCHLEVEFKRPVLLPSLVLITSRRDESGGVELAVTTPDGAIPHLRMRASGLV